MNEEDLMPARRQPPILLLILALLVVGGGLFVFLDRGQRVSRQADKALTTQDQQMDRMRQVDPALVKWLQVKQIPMGDQQPTCLASAPAGPFVTFGQTIASLDMWPKGRETVPFVPTCLDFVAGQVCYAASRDRVFVRQKVRPIWSPLTPSLGARAVITGLAALGDDIWIADSGHRVIWHYDSRGQLLGSFGGREGKDKAKGLIVPSPHLKVVIRSGGNLVVNNPGRLRVDTYSPSGALKSSFGRDSVDISGFCGCCNPIDIDLLYDDDIVTAEKGLPRVKVYRADGTLESVVAAPADLSPHCEPQIAVNSQGQIVVLDAPAHVVRVFERKQ